MERSLGQRTFVVLSGQEHKICELPLLILGHLNHEEEYFDVSFPVRLCEKVIFQPCKGFVVQA